MVASVVRNIVVDVAVTICATERRGRELDPALALFLPRANCRETGFLARVCVIKI